MSVRILVGDCIEMMRPLEPKSVQCIVTSPPYFGLRDYGTGEWEGGDVWCDHTANANRSDRARNGLTGGLETVEASTIYRSNCGKCGARRIDKQIGLESSPADYIAKLVAVFDVAREVLADDGTLWLNVGDSYAGGKTGNTNGGASSGLKRDGRDESSRSSTNEALACDMATMVFRKDVPVGLKPKDLIGIPWMLAFALRDAGWYLRQEIIWAKPNPMPESVTDRCTKAHESIFMLAKQPRYYFDAAAIAERAIHADIGTNRGGSLVRVGDDALVAANNHKGDAWASNGTRNKRSVWTIATQPFSGVALMGGAIDHFATFPPALVEPCILAGSRAGDTVLDPFGGAGTTGLVADRLGRNAVLCELNPSYADMARRRIANDSPLFAEVA